MAAKCVGQRGKGEWQQGVSVEATGFTESFHSPPRSAVRITEEVATYNKGLKHAHAHAHAIAPARRRTLKQRCPKIRLSLIQYDGPRT